MQCSAMRYKEGKVDDADFTPMLFQYFYLLTDISDG